MTDWQSLISDTAVQLFTRTGRLDAFKLARGDLVELAAQVMKRDPVSVAQEMAESPGFLTVRCLVQCEPLGRAIVVDEWVKTPALAMAQAVRRVNADIIRSERENP